MQIAKIILSAAIATTGFATLAQAQTQSVANPVTVPGARWDTYQYQQSPYDPIWSSEVRTIVRGTAKTDPSIQDGGAGEE